VEDGTSPAEIQTLFGGEKAIMWELIDFILSLFQFVFDILNSRDREKNGRDLHIQTLFSKSE